MRGHGLGGRSRVVEEFVAIVASEPHATGAGATAQPGGMDDVVAISIQGGILALLPPPPGDPFLLITGII